MGKGEFRIESIQDLRDYSRETTFTLHPLSIRCGFCTERHEGKAMVSLTIAFRHRRPRLMTVCAECADGLSRIRFA